MSIRIFSVIVFLGFLARGTTASALPARNSGWWSLAAASSTRGGAVEKEDRMPSLFSQSESQYDRYAACLAATEGLRRLRDKELAEAKRKKSEEQTDAQKRIAAEYAHNSAKVLKALGLSVSQFNQLGRLASQDDRLKEKVMEQAYLYRMASMIKLERIPVEEDPSSSKMLKMDKRKQVEMFCDSMVEIEQLRTEQLERLKKSLRVNKLPSDISLTDPNILPFLNQKVRAVAEAFPLQAEEIVKKHGLQSDEFNNMLIQTKSNPMFRRQIENEIKSKGAEKKTKKATS